MDDSVELPWAPELGFDVHVDETTCPTSLGALYTTGEFGDSPWCSPRYGAHPGATTLPISSTGESNPRVPLMPTEGTNPQSPPYGPHVVDNCDVQQGATSSISGYRQNNSTGCSHVRCQASSSGKLNPHSSFPDTRAADTYEAVAVEDNARQSHELSSDHSDRLPGTSQVRTARCRRSRKQRRKWEEKKARRAPAALALVVGAPVVLILFVLCSFSSHSIYSLRGAGIDNESVSQPVPVRMLTSSSESSLCIAPDIHPLSSGAMINATSMPLMAIEIQLQEQSVICKSFERTDEISRLSLNSELHFKPRANATPFVEAKLRQGNLFHDVCCRQKDEESNFLKACFSIGRHGTEFARLEAGDETKNNYDKEKAKERRLLRRCHLHSEGEFLVLLRTESRVQDREWAKGRQDDVIVPYIKFLVAKGCPIVMDTDKNAGKSGTALLNDPERAKGIVFINSSEGISEEHEDVDCSRFFRKEL